MSHRLVYTSHTTRPLSADDLAKILADAAVSNAQDHITGLLIYCRDSFLQILEGPERSIQRTMKRIRAASQHTDLRILTDTETSEKPMFSQWSMGYWVPGLAAFEGLPAPLTDNRFIADWEGAYIVLDRYRRGDWKDSAS